jgi:hypothetical protein
MNKRVNEEYQKLQSQLKALQKSTSDDKYEIAELRKQRSIVRLRMKDFGMRKLVVKYRVKKEELSKLEKDADKNISQLKSSLRKEENRKHDLRLAINRYTCKADNLEARMLRNRIVINQPIFHSPSFEFPTKFKKYEKLFFNTPYSMEDMEFVLSSFVQTLSEEQLGRAKIYKEFYLLFKNMEI